MDVGFIGIGGMGAAMVPNLVGAGHRVSVWNRDPKAAQALDGVTVLASPAAAFDNDAVGDDAVRRHGRTQASSSTRVFLASARRDCIHVMMSTISPALVESLHALHGVPESPMWQHRCSACGPQRESAAEHHGGRRPAAVAAVQTAVRRSGPENLAARSRAGTRQYREDRLAT